MVRTMSAKAPVVKHDAGSITFQVDDVTPGSEKFEQTSAASRLEQQTGRKLWVMSHRADFPVLADNGHHPLISAVHHAFSRHCPVALTPDIVWLTIAQGFSQHVNNNAEQLRDILVYHTGRKTLTAVVKELTRFEHWTGAVAQWEEQIEQAITPELHGSLLCDFSTSTPITRTASAIVMMETFKTYFDYHLYCICGIPTVTLYGTPNDWRVILRRVERLSHFHLSWWTDRLLPLCEQFVKTAEGEPSVEFWQNIYKPKQIYGGGITGWLADLFPYIISEQFDRRSAPTLRNPILSIPRHNLVVEDGLRLDCFPAGLSCVPVLLEFGPPINVKRPLEFVGGFLGVVEDTQTGCLQAEIGWAVQPVDAYENTLNTIEREHETYPAPTSEELRQIYESPAELLQMLERFDGARLFGDTAHLWNIRRCQHYTMHPAAGNYRHVTCFMDLADGRSIGYRFEHDKPNRNGLKGEWIILVGRLETNSDEPSALTNERAVFEDVRQIATGIPDLFTKIFNSQGRYFFDL